MSQHNEKNPHQHQSPLHDSSEAKPGMDSLAPEDGSHRPTAEPTPPGAQPTTPGSLKAPDTRNEKLNSLEDVRKGSENFALTTNQGVRIADDQNSLRAGSRGPTLLEDFILREKITHFDHERIPERIVHARGSAAHGYFQPYKSLSDITKADFLSDPNKITPVLLGSLPFRVVLALPIPCVISVALPPSSIPKRVFLTSLAITRQSSLSRMRINSPILFMR